MVTVARNSWRYSNQKYCTISVTQAFIGEQYNIAATPRTISKCSTVPCRLDEFLTIAPTMTASEFDAMCKRGRRPPTSFMTKSKYYNPHPYATLSRAQWTICLVHVAKNTGQVLPAIQLCGHCQYESVQIIIVIMTAEL